MGSASELEYHLLLAKDLKLIPPPDFEEPASRATELKRMLSALIQKLKADSFYRVISFAAASTKPMAQPDASSRRRMSRFSAGRAQR